jgi:CheY-like chemotaxis protein
MRVLLLGADDTIAHLREFLERRGCQCSAANSLGESIAIFEPRSFDLILNTLTTRILNLSVYSELRTVTSSVLTRLPTVVGGSHNAGRARLFRGTRLASQRISGGTPRNSACDIRNP